MIQVMIAEDEIMAQKELIYLLEQEADMSICPSAQTGEQLVALYNEYQPDAVFLDVEMPGMTGVAAANAIVRAAGTNQPLFIFTTAYDNYALDAFEIAAVDYLLKPYDESRFQAALEKLRSRLSPKQDAGPEYGKTSARARTAKLLVEDGEKMVVLDPEKILYAVPHNRMLEIHTVDLLVMSKLSLQELEDKLAGHSFFRTHRSYLVNLNYIEEITPWFNGTCNVTLRDESQTKIPVSRAARKQLLEHFTP